ncbi:MAG: DUF7594 domain-containing protein, partial [Opitutaceae bacterium]
MKVVKPTSLERLLSGSLALLFALCAPVFADTTLSATADSFVLLGNPDTNFGSDTTLKVQATTGGTGWNERYAYLKFDLSSVASIGSGSKLRLYRANTGTNVGNEIRSSTNTTWTETGITWNNKPAVGTTAHATGTWGSGWNEWNITAFLQAEKAAGRNVVTLIVRNTATSAGYKSARSRENTSGNNPQLLIVTTAGAPEVNVTGAGLNILDGDTTPQTADGTDFGSADITSGTVQKVFNIQNTGSATLTLGNVTTTNSEFGVLTQPALSIPAGGNSNFEIAFI